MKISELTTLSSPAAGDLFPIVDISDTSMAPAGTDKKITLAALESGLTLANMMGNITVSQLAGGSGASASTFFRGDGTWGSPTAANVGLGNVDNTSDATKNSATVTLTNKRITKRVQSVSNSATITPNADSDDCIDITAIAQNFTIANPSGTPTNFQSLIIRIKDNGTARTISFGTNYVAGGVSLPTTTILSKILVLGFMYNTANSLNKWQLIASAQEA